MSKTTLLSIVMIFIIAILVLIKNTKNDENYVVLKGDSVILAFGDSLTNGFGVAREFSYPMQLQKKKGFKVINAGIDGEFSSQGLVRLPLLLQQKPDLVILCHGGNDILNKVSSIKLKNNLLLMVKLIRKSGAKVLLVGVPDFNVFSFDTHRVYEEVADETGILFEYEVLREIELNRSLKSDYVHPNKKGYEMMADAFIKILEI